MTFQQLQYLMEVYRTGSISKAANNLYVSRPSVSFSINSLEEEIGFPIFQRTRQGLIPSAQGVQFLDYANTILSTYRQMNKLRTPQQIRSINFAIFSYRPIVQATREFLSAHSTDTDTRYSFCVYTANDIFDRLSSFDLDLAIFARFKTNRTIHEKIMSERKLEWKYLGNIETVLYIGPGHRLYNKPDLSLQDFQDDFFLDTPSMEISKNGIIRKTMHIPQNKIIPCNESSIKHDLIENGLAYTIGKMPAKETVQRRMLRCIPIDELSQPIYCAYNPARPLAPEAKEFLEIVEKNLSDSV